MCIVETRNEIHGCFLFFGRALANPAPGCVFFFVVVCSSVAMDYGCCCCCCLFVRLVGCSFGCLIVFGSSFRRRGCRCVGGKNNWNESRSTLSFRVLSFFVSFTVLVRSLCVTIQSSA